MHSDLTHTTLIYGVVGTRSLGRLSQWIPIHIGLITQHSRQQIAFVCSKGRPAKSNIFCLSTELIGAGRHMAPL